MSCVGVLVFPCVHPHRSKQCIGIKGLQRGNKLPLPNMNFIRHTIRSFAKLALVHTHSTHSTYTHAHRVSLSYNRFHAFSVYRNTESNALTQSYSWHLKTCNCFSLPQAHRWLKMVALGSMTQPDLSAASVNPLLVRGNYIRSQIVALSIQIQWRPKRQFGKPWGQG